MTAVARRSHIWPRPAHDWFVEPRDCTLALTSVEHFEAAVWDPCCGQGHVVEGLRAAGVRAIGTDRVRRTLSAPWWSGAHDFFETLWTSPRAPIIASNPPFFGGRGTEDFIRKALAIPGLEKLAVFTDVAFLTSAGRAAGLYAEAPPHRAWILTPRPSCPPGDYLLAGNRAQGGTADWCWLVWELTAPPARPGETRLGWARRPM